MTIYHDAADWLGRKCIFLGLEWRFTFYEFMDQQLFITKGFWKQTRTSYYLSAMKQVHIEQSFWQKIIQTGDVVITMTDGKTIVVENVKDSDELFDLISDGIGDIRMHANFMFNA